METQYRRLCLGTFNTKGILVPASDWKTYIKDYNKANYLSVFNYSTAHYKQFQESGTVANISDVVTDHLVWDFDSKEDVNKAKEDVLTLFSRFKESGISPNATQLYFSGQKGFTVVVQIDKELTPEETKNVCINYFAKGLETADLTVYNASRILRIPFTKHQESGLYKIPLEPKSLKSTSIDTIKLLAKNPTQFTENFTYDKALYDERWNVKTVTEPTQHRTSVDLTEKPNNWRACKWNLLQGNFSEGERHTALTILAATGRSLGYDKTTVYYLCKSAIKKQAILTKTPEFGKDELWVNIIEKSVFSNNWKGGAYSCKTDPWLSHYCKELGDKGCQDSQDKDETIVPISKAFDYFEDYAQNIEELTMKTGIVPLDNKIRLTIGMVVGLVAPPSSGKTSLALQFLNSMSKSGTQCVFFSYDMYHSLVYQKLIQKHFGMKAEEIFNKFKNKDEDFKKKVSNLLNKEYENVQFCFETGQSVENMMKSIEEAQDKTGKKVRFIVVDYNELITTDKQDSTAASAYTIQSLRAMASMYNACVLVLLQPNKLNADPSEEITTYQAAKGSSSIAQAVSVMFGVNRPGFDPRHPHNDKFITIKCLKHRMGDVFSLDLHWNGLKGEVRELNDDELEELNNIRMKKTEEKVKNAWS